MFSAVDKMIAAFVSSGVAYIVGSGALTAAQGVSLEAIVTALVAAGVTALATYLVPNKA